MAIGAAYVERLRLRAMTNRPAAIKLFCIECVGGECATRADITNCTATACPLYAHRPYRNAEPVKAAA